MFYWAFLSLICILISCCSTVQGLECYVCDMEDCAKEVSSKSSKYLVDCGASAIACATFTVETSDSYSINKKENEIWFQRTCLYQEDLSCWEKSEPPGRNIIRTWHYANPFHQRVTCVNSKRFQSSLPAMKEVPINSFIRRRDPTPEMKFESCGNDSCNSWDGEARPQTSIHLADGFPVDEFKERKEKGIPERRCYFCDSNMNHAGIKKSCENHWKIYKDETEPAPETYGCAMLAIYQIAGGLDSKTYFERSFWFPGDDWCLQRKFNSSPTERSLEKSSLASIRYHTDKNGKTCKDDDYSRALSGRNSDSFKYEWIGQREFYSAEEFISYLKCRDHVKLKLGIYWQLLGKEVIWDMEFNEAAARAAWAKKPEGVFAFVGFRFCGAEDFCNDWTEKQLYEKMEVPPGLKSKNGTSEWKDGCRKEKKNEALKTAAVPGWLIYLVALQSGMISPSLLE